jgi:hypothetical protein
VDTSLDLIQCVNGIELAELEPKTAFLVWTWNSLYRVVVADGSEVLIQGGAFFPEPTPAHVDGSSAGRSVVKTGWIGVGLLMVFQVGGQRIVTTQIIAIATERRGMSVVH